MIDPTETIRRQMSAEINAQPGSLEYLEAKHGQVWDTGQLQDDFKVIGFGAPLVVVRRRRDGVKGSLMFQASPRFYFGFEPARHRLDGRARKPAHSGDPLNHPEGRRRSPVPQFSSHEKWHGVGL